MQLLGLLSKLAHIILGNLFVQFTNIQFITFHSYAGNELTNVLLILAEG